MEEKVWKKRLTKSLLGLKMIKTVIYIIIILAIAFMLFYKFDVQRVFFNSSSNLTKIEEVQRFNLVKFDWTGIASYYKNNSVDTYIKYDATILATMDMSNFNQDNLSVDEINKVIYVTLPKIELEPTIIFKENGESFSFIPENTKIEMKDIIATCEEDAKKKVLEKVALLDIAKENAKSTIEGLLLPLMEEKNYSIIWKDGE